MKTNPPQRLVVDTDMGTDDAAAVAWLFMQQYTPVEIMGISAVWGNSSVENVTGNIHSLLAALHQHNTPVVLGESQPLHGKRLSLGAMMHGNDGLWGHRGSFSKNQFDDDLLGFYEKLAPHAEGATLLTLGPLTNLARVLETNPALLRPYSRVVILGGSYRAGGMTPTAETNVWQDPHAAQKVLFAGLPITLVTRDAHTMFSLSLGEIELLTSSRNDGARFLAKPLRAYAAAQSKVVGAIHCADVVAAMCAVEPSVATRIQRALVHVVTSDNRLVRGQTVMGFTPSEKIPMLKSLADLEPIIQRHLTDASFDMDQAIGAILAQGRDNADVVLSIAAARVKTMFLHAMTTPTGE